MQRTLPVLNGRAAISVLLTLAVVAGCAPAAPTSAPPTAVPQPTQAPAPKSAAATPSGPAAAQTTAAPAPAAGKPLPFDQYVAKVGKPAQDARAAIEGTPRVGGILKVAQADEPATFDGHLTTRANALEINALVAEGLFAFDAKGSPAPALVDTVTANADKTRYTLKLRTNVPFQSGKLLTSADVVASLKRWLTGSLGKDAGVHIKDITAPDPATVVIDLKDSFPFILTQLAVPQGGGAFIYPQELVEKAGKDDIGMPVGTGPYRVKEYKQNQYVDLVRFDGYVGREEPPSMWAGGKVAYLDEIVLNFVPDEPTRIAGVQSGDYQVAWDVSPDNYPRFANDPTVRPRIIPGDWICAAFNKKSGPMADLRVRQAFVAAVDVKKIAATVGPPEFVRADPGLMHQSSAWYSEAGKDVYYGYDPEKARALLKDAGYAGQPIRWLVDQSRWYLYQPAIVAKPMLEQVGFSIDLQTVDSATLATLRADPNRMDAFACNLTPRQDPTLIVLFNSAYPGWWDTPPKNGLVQKMQSEPDFAKKQQIWPDLQAQFYKDVAMAKFFSKSDLNLEAKKYSGAWYEVGYRYYANSWLNN